MLISSPQQLTMISVHILPDYVHVYYATKAILSELTL